MLGLGTIGQYAIGEQTLGAAAAAEFIGPDKYMPAFGLPVRFKPGLQTGMHPFTFLQPSPVVSFGWMEALTEPVRQLPRSPAALSPVHFFEPMPSPFVATGWFMPLAEPVRKLRGLDPGQQQFLGYQSNPITVTPFAWFAGLSEPKRFRPELRASLQQFFTIDPTVIPTSKLIEWFAGFSEPVRFKPALGPWLQQFLATPPRLLPTPSITGVLSALETKDVFLGGLAAFNRVISGEVGIIENNFTGAEIGIVEQAASAGTSGVIEQAAAPTPGAAVPTITSAHVSIRIV